MKDRWQIRGPSYTNCNCAHGCPCQFGSSTTNGFCRALAAGTVTEGFWNDVRLDGLHYVVLVAWPGEIAQGNGREQHIIDERANPEQREALGKILRGESTAPGATHFNVFASTMSEILDPIYAPIECAFDVEERTARVRVPGLVESEGTPMVNAFDGSPVRAGIGLPGGFEFTYAEVASGTTRVRAGIELDLSKSHSHLFEMQLCQDGCDPLTRRDRIAVLAALAAAMVLAWTYIVSMSGMEELCAINVAWGPRDFALMLVMWIVMMVGMMLPAATPMTLIYAQVARKARRDGSVLPPTAVFVAGYLLAWTLFSVAATLAQWGLDRAALLTPMWEANGTRLGAALLFGAGLYQLTPWKNACLSHCQNPAFYFAQHFRPGARGALGLGFRHGLYCLGCCGVLMGLLFVGGVMNLLWIAGLAIFVLAENAIPVGPWGARVAGVALVASGVLLLVR